MYIIGLIIGGESSIVREMRNFSSPNNHDRGESTIYLFFLLGNVFVFIVLLFLKLFLNQNQIVQPTLKKPDLPTSCV
jgi:hypothetical protein